MAVNTYDNSIFNPSFAEAWSFEVLAAKVDRKILFFDRGKNDIAVFYHDFAQEVDVVRVWNMAKWIAIEYRDAKFGCHFF